MNLSRSALMDDVAETSFAADVDGIVTLGALPVAMTVKTPNGGTAIDRSTGLRTVATDDDSVTGFLAALSTQQIGETPGALLGDSWLLLVKADLSVPPTVDSWATATDTGTRYKVLAVIDPALNSHYRLHVRAHA